MSLRRRIDEMRLALMLLTRLPAGRLTDPAPDLAEARWAYPLVGLVVGFIGWAAFHLALSLGLAPLASALIAFAATALATGALHHDGFADFGDGIGGGRDRPHRLEIMRDSRIGSYGALALIFAVALPVAGLAGIASDASLPAFMLIGVASRLAMSAVIELLPPARKDGLGNMTTGQDWRCLIPGGVLAIVLAVLTGTPGWIALLLMAAAAGLVAAVALRKLGGQTGDVLGAAQIGAECLGWLTLAAGFG